MIFPLKILAKHAAGDNAYIYERVLKENSSTAINMLNNLILNNLYVVNYFAKAFAIKYMHSEINLLCSSKRYHTGNLPRNQRTKN